MLFSQWGHPEGGAAGEGMEVSSSLTRLSLSYLRNTLMEAWLGGWGFLELSLGWREGEPFQPLRGREEGAMGLGARPGGPAHLMASLFAVNSAIRPPAESEGLEVGGPWGGDRAGWPSSVGSSQC